MRCLYFFGTSSSETTGVDGPAAGTFGIGALTDTVSSNGFSFFACATPGPTATLSASARTPSSARRLRLFLT